MNTIMIFWRRKPRVEALLPKIGVSELLPEEISVKIQEADTKDGNVSFGELVLIAQLVKLRKPSRIFEIGTFDGRTTLNLAINSGDGAQIFTLDLEAGEKAETSAGGDKKFMGKVETGYRFKKRLESSKIIQLLGDSAKFNFANFHNSIDFVFIDGSHAYEYIKKDSETAFEITKPRLPDGQAGATILWHDYNTSWPGVTEALNELYQSDPRFKNLHHITGTSLVILRI